MSAVYERPLPSGVEVITRTPEKIAELWVRLRHFDRLFSDHALGNRDAFEHQMSAPDTALFQTEGGVMLLTDIKYGNRAEAHVAFWDKHLSSRTELIRGTLQWAFGMYDLHRVEVIIPVYARALRHFLEKRLKFVREGVLRKRLMKDGAPCDQIMYSILRHEVNDSG